MPSPFHESRVKERISEAPYAAKSRDGADSKLRDTSLKGRVRRFVMACIIDSDIDTATAIVLSFQVALIAALFFFPEKIVKLPPPVFDGVWVRLPAMVWAVAIFTGILWQGRGWAWDMACTRLWGTGFSSVVLCVLCGDMSPRGPALATAVFILNLWQIIIAGRLYNECVETKNKGR